MNRSGAILKSCTVRYDEKTWPEIAKKIFDVSRVCWASGDAPMNFVPQMKDGFVHLELGPGAAWDMVYSCGCGDPLCLDLVNSDGFVEMCRLAFPRYPFVCCPECGHEHEISVDRLARHGEEMADECQACGRRMKITASVSYSVSRS